MKTRTKIYLTVTLTITAAIVYWACDLSYHNFLPQPSLPKQYKDYRLPEAQPESPHYRMELLVSGKIEAPYYDSAGRTVILEAGRDVGQPDGNTSYTNTYYKLDASGNMVDSFVDADEILFRADNYLLQQDHYYTWIIDGDTTAHPYGRLEEDTKDADPKKLLAAYYNRASLIYFYNSYDVYSDDSTDKDRDRIVLLIDQQWYQLRGYELVDYNLYPPKYTAVAVLLPNLAPGNDDLRNNVRDWHKTGQPLSIGYFQKTRFRNGHGPAFMSPTGNSTPARWEGNAFMNLLIEQDTLKIREEELVLIEDDPWYYYESWTHATMCYYTRPELHFGLFTDNNYNIYIIKKKPGS